MSKTENKNIIDIPIRLIFSKSGISYFIKQGKKLSRFKLSDNREEFGIQLTDFTPATVQKMQVLGYIKEIEFPVTNIPLYRNRIIDFTKLITYGLLYMQFSTVVFDTFLQSDLVQTWNRKNAKNPIDFKTELNHAVLNRFLNENRKAYEILKEEIIMPVLHEEKRRKSLGESEIVILGFLADKLLSRVNPLIWFLLITNSVSPDVDHIVSAVRTHLVSYLKKSPVTEYFACMLIEVLMSTRQLADQSADSAEAPDNDIFLLWKIKKDIHRADDRGKLHVTISNSRSKFEEVRSSIHYRAGQSVKAKNLESFYSDELSKDSESHLGLYYLSFLEEACSSMNLKFESFVNYDRTNRQTLINLILTF